MEEKLRLVSRGSSEIVTEEELREMVSKGTFSAYCGYEPSGEIHFGHVLTAFKLVDLQKAGGRVTVLLADLHAYLNGKGELEEIRRIAEYNKHCFIALGLDPKTTDFRLGSEFQMNGEYIIDVMRMATQTTLLRARRSMAEIARRVEDPDVAQVIYPIMQAVDIAHLKVDIAVGGKDQRKVHMIAREKLPALGYKKPVCLHLPLLHGIDGSEKMSSSRGNFISVRDPPNHIKEKIGRAFCPPRVIDGNPVIEYAEQLVLPRLGTLKIERAQKHGGPLEIETTSELRDLYSEGKLHPADLKAGVASGLIELFAPVRTYFEKAPHLVQRD
ncbi:MAG: tyrosine--tRNA ligase [Candidatus Hadarchaeales archaeon]